MVEHGPGPVARMWRLTGGDLHDPAVADAFCAEVVPRLKPFPGYLGVLVLVDRAHRVLVGLNYWESAQAELGSRHFGASASHAMRGLSSSEFEGPWTWDVLGADFRGVLAQESQMSEVGGLVLREDRCPVEDVAPAQLTRSVEAMASAAECTGTLALRGRELPELVVMSLWVGGTGAQAAADLPATAGACSTTVSGPAYDVVVHQPMAPPAG